jgi:hypothetical protein
MRSLFWPGFVAGFLLLSIVSCGGVVMATGVSRINLASFQDNGAAWSPPPTPPTLVAQPAAGGEGTAGGVVIDETGGAYRAGDVVRNITASRVNIRAAPGYLGKPDGDVIAQVLPGETMEVLGERALADNLTWWRIRFIPAGALAGARVVEGWVAEATASGVQILGR